MGEETNRHTAGQRELAPEELPRAIRLGLEELQGAFPCSGARSVHWNDNYVGLVIDVPVDLPTRGPVGGVDIREIEPVVLLLNRRRYPRSAPFVYSDRRDFPSSRLAHLIPTGTRDRACLCLHRGSIDDWFAEHSLTDLVERVKSWLRDAAGNRLIREEDRFEGTRIDGSVGIVVYPPAEITGEVERRWSAQGNGAGHCYLMMTILKGKAAKQYLSLEFSYRVDFAFPEQPTGKLLDLFRRYNKVFEKEPQEDRLLIGILAWAPRAPLAEYFGALPETYGELRAFCRRIGVGLEAVVEEYRSLGAQVLQGTPIALALLRPQVLIGSMSPIELLHFVVLGTDEYTEPGGGWKDEAPVHMLAHRTSLTVAFARDLSHENPARASAFTLVGCGAVGSKISVHLARAGHVDQILVDPAELSPHHLVRHGLGPEDVGENKAVALAATITSMYRLDQEQVHVRAIPRSIYDLFDHGEDLANVPFILDATASSSVLSAFIEGDGLPGRAHYARCEIADEGRLGLLWWEGAERNPRIDDLQAFLFNLGQREGVIANWLRRHREAREGARAAQLEEIGIGVSCSSTTLRLPDDVISYHAALFSIAYKQRDRWVQDGSGWIKLSLLDRDQGARAARTLRVSPVTILAAANGGSWQVRLSTGVRDRLVSWMRQAGKNETGGLLLGFAHRKRGVI